MITFRIASRLKICKELMVKYNRTDLFPLLKKYPKWNSDLNIAIWQCAYQDASDTHEVLTFNLYQLLGGGVKVGPYCQRHYYSFDTALIAYTKALKKYVRTNKI